MKTEIKRACGYVRVSTKEQAEKGTSLKDQKKKIEEHCKSHGWKLIEIYQDAGLSGSATERPALIRMIKHAKEKRFDVIVFWSLDRLGRTMLHIVKLFEELHDNNVAVSCISQSFLNSTEDSPSGKLVRDIFSSLCEFESKLTGQRTRAGRRFAFKAGKAFPGLPPYGYRWNSELNKVEPDKERAEILKYIFDLYFIERLSTQKIALHLTEKRIPSPNSRRIKDKSKIIYRWSPGTVLRILRQKAYKGATVFYLTNDYTQVYSKDGNPYFKKDKDKPRDQEPIEITFPQLIDEEKWDLVQNRLDFNTRKPKKLHKKYAKDHFLANSALGLHFRCGLCDSSIMSRVIRRRKDGPVRLRYQCNLHVASADRLVTEGKERCELPSMDSDKIDNIVWQHIKSFLTDPIEFGKKWLRKPDHQKILNEVESLNKRKERLFKEVDTLSRRMVEDISDRFRKSFQKRQKELDQELDTIEARIKNKNKELESVSVADEYLKELEQEIEEAKHRKKQARKSRDPKNPRKAIINIKSIAEKLDDLPFETKKEIIESIISPESGGYIRIGLRPLSDFYKSRLPSGVVDTMVPKVEFDANVDVLRLKYIIKSLQDRSISGSESFRTHQSKQRR